MADLGLATAAATAKELKTLLNLLPEEKGRPKFGFAVEPENEGRCPYIEVFMASQGRKYNITNNMELRRGRFQPMETALDARAAFGKERGRVVGQEDIQDENGFILPNSLLKEPMYTLSKGCRLNLNFVYRHNVISSGVATAGDAVNDAGATLVNATTNTPNWWPSWRSSPNQPQKEDSKED